MHQGLRMQQIDNLPGLLKPGAARSCVDRFSGKPPCPFLLCQESISVASATAAGFIIYDAFHETSESQPADPHERMRIDRIHGRSQRLGRRAIHGVGIGDHILHAHLGIAADSRKCGAGSSQEDPDLYEHDDEGPDDMPAHLRAALTLVQLSIPIVGHRLALGTWQGIYLFEHRRRPHERKIVLHAIGE